MAISRTSGSRLRAGKFHDGEVVDGRALAAPCHRDRRRDQQLAWWMDYRRRRFRGVTKKASLITPIPRGVGVMIVTMLRENMIASAERVAARRRGGSVRAIGGG